MRNLAIMRGDRLLLWTSGRSKMATTKKGHLSRARGPFDWAKHLRWGKRLYWKSERQAGKAEAVKQRDQA